jgi:isopentenyl-diphosphate delta-isomerase
MLKDQCILVNDADKVIGHASKAAAHRFDGHNPNGLLHRAFSVFLFDSAGMRSPWSSELSLPLRRSRFCRHPKPWLTHKLSCLMFTVAPCRCTS